MTILREARAIAEKTTDPDLLRAESIVLGLGYTGVKLSDGNAGVCHSLVQETSPDCCDILDRAGSLTEQPLRDLLDLTESWNLFERIIGVVSLNALSQRHIGQHSEDYPVFRGNLIEVLEVEASDTVAMVGMIKPFVQPLRERSKRLHILERGSPRPEGVLPDTACEEVIPQSDVVLITGSTLANGTLDRLLELAADAKKTAVVGPTVSIAPDPLFKRGVDYCGGVSVKDPDLLMKVLREAGGTPHMKRAAVELVTYMNPE
ncbi:DUF364 domain-containing protein [Candidatus Bathyarchaeota archaeon]|nr:DUF364 domain-containing protein [Candidatus Bathyarchaeota archaeon]